MCNLCDEITSSFTFKDVLKLDAFVSALLTHFVTKTGEEIVWDNAKVFAVMEQYIPSSELTEALRLAPDLKKLFCLGASCALEMVANANEVAKVRVYKNTEEDLAPVRAALADLTS